MKRLGWLAPVLAVVLLSWGCTSEGDESRSPDTTFSTPTDGSVRIAQGTAGYLPGDLQVGVGGVLKDPDRAMLSVMKAGAESVQLTLGVDENGMAHGETVTVTGIERGDHDYAWVKVSPP